MGTGTQSSATLFHFLTQEKQRAADIPKALQTLTTPEITPPQHRSDSRSCAAIKPQDEGTDRRDFYSPRLFFKKSHTGSTLPRPLGQENRQATEKEPSEAIHHLTEHEAQARRSSPAVCDPKETIRALRSEVSFTGGILHSCHVLSSQDEDTKICHLQRFYALHTDVQPLKNK